MTDFTINSTELFDVQIEDDQVRVGIVVDTDQGKYTIVDFYHPLDNTGFIVEEVKDLMEEEQEEAKMDKFNEMRELLSAKGFTKEDIADLAEYQRD